MDGGGLPHLVDLGPPLPGASDSPPDDEGDVETGAPVELVVNQDRGATGTFTGGHRNYRKQEAPSFPVVQAALLESADCGQSSGCASTLRCAAHGGTQCQQWLIRGPVFGWSDDAVHLSANITVRAALSVPVAEVYVRALPHLVPTVYGSSTAAYNSVRFVAHQQVVPVAGSDTAVTSSSFRGLTVGERLSDKDVKEVIKRASASLQAARGKLLRGHVSLVSRSDALGDTVRKGAVRAALRRRSRGAARDYREKGARLLRDRTAGLHGLLGAGAISRVRRHLELQDNPAHGSRATRLRIAFGLSQMRLFPARDQLQRLRREALDAPGRVAHYFLTYSVLGALQRWDYIVGSGSAGIRRYRAACGTEKRLRAHTNLYWDKRRAARDYEDVSDDEDDGVYFDNSNVELNGCYAPEEKDPVAIEQLIANGDSFFENDDGGGQVEVLGVGFDVVAALQHTLDTKAEAGMTEDDVRCTAPAVGTFAADGGELRRRSITAYTFSVTSSCLLAGRTDLFPILYVFSGEKRVGRLLTRWVRDQLAAILASTLRVPGVGRRRSDGDAGPSVCLEAAAGAGMVGDSGLSVPLIWHPYLQVCGTFTTTLWVACIDYDCPVGA